MKFEEEGVKYVCDWLTQNKPEQDCDFYKMWIGVEILRALIDNEWTNQAIFPNDHPATSKETQSAISFLRTNEIGFQLQERVFRLANRLFDIQDVPNLDKVVSAIKEGDIALGYAEIEASSFFKRRNIEHEFVVPTGEKGKDFDIKINELNINCEVKHKIEETAPSKRALERTLSSAKEQVPSDESALFFIKIPEEWIAHNDIKNIVERVKGSFFPRSKNVLGFILHWEERFLENEGIFYWKYRYERNIHCDKQNDEFTDKILNVDVDLNDSITKLMNKYLKKCKNYPVTP